MIKHNTERKPKGLWTANNGGEKIKYYEAMTERDEAEYVVREIIKHRKSGKDYNDMAILYRTNAQSRVRRNIYEIKYSLYDGWRPKVL